MSQSDYPASAQPAAATGDLLECDVIFRGGVTSGVIYPGTVAGLAERYRFVQIGGASAGAIAAGIAAAAEYARQIKGDKNAFAAVPGLAEEVSGGKDSMTSLQKLFRAQSALWFLDLLLWQGMRLKTLWWPLFILLIPAFAFAAIGFWYGSGFAVALNLAFLGIVVSAIVMWLQVGVMLPRCGFGLSSGINPRAEQTDLGLRKNGALMDWIHATVQRLAGRAVGKLPDLISGAGPSDVPLDSIDADARPLIMADLWGGANPKEARAIDLVLTTSNLSQQLPHQFPFLERRPHGELYFQPQELARYLPKDVVNWMVAAARPLPKRFAEEDKKKYLRLPEPHHLPIVFGIRLSLSFPGLIAAVPLYAQDYTPELKQKRALKADGADEAAEEIPRKLRRCWFSDGGITSNFPVHLFDSVLPTRPTFGVDLRDATPGPDGAWHDPDPAVQAGIGTDPLIWMPRSNADDIAPRFQEDFDSLLGFVMAIVSTARNGQENELMMMPGHRDRVVHIETNAKEGGMNLHMDEDTIKALSARGLKAAQLLRTRFDPQGEASKLGFVMNWRNQRWIRFRSTMAALERVLADLERAWRVDTQGSYDFASEMRHWDPNDQENNKPTPPGHRATPSYKWPNSAAAMAAADATDEILDLAKKLRAAAAAFNTPTGGVGSIFDNVSPATGRTRDGAPLPKLALKARPTGEDPRRVDTYPR